MQATLFDLEKNKADILLNAIKTETLGKKVMVLQAICLCGFKTIFHERKQEVRSLSKSMFKKHLMPMI